MAAMAKRLHRARRRSRHGCLLRGAHRRSVVGRGRLSVRSDQQTRLRRDRELRRRARLPDNRVARGQKPLVSPDPMIAGSKAVARAADARAAEMLPR